MRRSACVGQGLTRVWVGVRVWVGCLHVEYAERGNEYGILFMLSLFCEHGNLEYVNFMLYTGVNQAEYGIRIRVAASQEYVNIYSTRRVGWCGGGGIGGG